MPTSPVLQPVIYKVELAVVQRQESEPICACVNLSQTYFEDTPYSKYEWYRYRTTSRSSMSVKTSPSPVRWFIYISCVVAILWIVPWWNKQDRNNGGSHRASCYAHASVWRSQVLSYNTIRINATNSVSYIIMEAVLIVYDCTVNLIPTDILHSMTSGIWERLFVVYTNLNISKIRYWTPVKTVSVTW